MAIKLAYSVVSSNGQQGSEFELTGLSQREFVLWLGNFFLKTLLPIKNGPITLDIRVTEPQERSAFIANLFYKGLTKQSSCVTKINVKPENFFTQAQKASIDSILKRNNTALQSELAKTVEKEAIQKKEISDRACKNGLISGLFSTILSYFNPLVVFNPIVSIVSGILVGVLSYCRVKFQSYIADEFYNTPAQINKIKSESEKEAFLCGTQATSWKGYFTSFINYKAYLHPMAFGAGLSQAMNHRDEIVTQVKSLQLK